MIKVAKVPKLIIKIIKTLLENCKNNQKISLKNLDFMPNLRLVYKFYICATLSKNVAHHRNEQ